MRRCAMALAYDASAMAASGLVTTADASSSLLSSSSCMTKLLLASKLLLLPFAKPLLEAPKPLLPPAKLPKLGLPLGAAGGMAALPAGPVASTAPPLPFSCCCWRCSWRCASLRCCICSRGTPASRSLAFARMGPREELPEGEWLLPGAGLLACAVDACGTWYPFDKGAWWCCCCAGCCGHVCACGCSRCSVGAPTTAGGSRVAVGAGAAPAAACCCCSCRECGG